MHKLPDKFGKNEAWFIYNFKSKTMKTSTSSIFSIIIFLFFSPYFLGAQFKTNYPDIPRIDVHMHAGNDSIAIAEYLNLRKLLLNNNAIDMAMWINLGNHVSPLVDLKKVLSSSQGRVLSAIADYSAHDGLRYPPDSLKVFQKQGYVGYKIWSGPWYRGLDKKEDGFPYINDPAHETTFAEMEKIGMLGTSIHVADPNGPWDRRGAWLKDPIEFWSEITAWRDVLEKHQNLVTVMAHSNWLLCQDAQIDYLRNMLATYPNLHVDLAATYQYYDLVNRDNLRSFIIEWADRILFATDIGAWTDKAETNTQADNYIRAFRILETSDKVKGGFFGENEISGLELPPEVLEKIYYKNAMRLYPRVKEQMLSLGYSLD